MRRAQFSIILWMDRWDPIHSTSESVMPAEPNPDVDEVFAESQRAKARRRQRRQRRGHPEGASRRPGFFDDEYAEEEFSSESAE